MFTIPAITQSYEISEKYYTEKIFKWKKEKNAAEPGFFFF